MKTETQISVLFHKVFNGQNNFMTPNVLRRRELANSTDKIKVYYEVSTGRGIGDDHDLFGITFILFNTETEVITKTDGLNRCLFSEEEISDYINSLESNKNLIVKSR